jgi:hypothetical protein
MDQRKLLGLCFKCGKKYFLGHHCKVKVQMLLGEEPIDPPDEDTPVSAVVGENMLTEEAIVSLHATHSNPSLNTMRFKDQIGRMTVCALIDSDSTHSFVDPLVLKDQ